MLSEAVGGLCKPSSVLSNLGEWGAGGNEGCMCVGVGGCGCVGWGCVFRARNRATHMLSKHHSAVSSVCMYTLSLCF